MEELKMRRLMELHSGVGVKVVTSEGLTLHYFYEDFDGPASGIKRAMAQLYPKQDKGLIDSICFYELQNQKGVKNGIC